ncbi:24098_t:CDS:2 [Cetraspora pellucida]|uniref:24098_t:CDS:1 n=1 Tax=Cetraspora pellucida TaxID=1433469 RepID=A0A9N9DHG0_9GLOM|nr:24098_t:CDS:2 [Cetraspora pellucida]
MNDSNNEFNFSSGQDKESNVELLASTSISTSALSTLFFERYTALELLDNKEVEVEKVSCKFEDCDTEYVWLGLTSNCITHLHDIHQITKESLKNTLVKAKQQTICQTSDTVSLTFDLWSSQAHDSYLGITCHWLTDSFDLHEIILNIGELNKHHASDIVESVNSVLNKFKINCQTIFSITTNNRSNVRSTVQQIGISNVKCAGHTLQLSVNLGLKKVDKIISKCKALISILSKEKKHRQLHEAQLQITSGLKELLDVIKDVNTCWNSTLYAIERLVYLKPAIIQLYSTLTNHTIRKVRKGAETMGPYIPFLEKFELLEELIKVLFPFDKAIQFLSGSKYPILGFMTPILEELACQLRYFIGQNSMAILVKDTILDNLIERWSNSNEIGMCCSFLNPCFKKLNFCTSAL